MKSLPALLLAIASAGVLACAEAEPPVNNATERRLIEIGSPSWSLGETDTLLASDVRDALLTRGMVVLLQPDEARVRAVDARTGAFRWAFGTRGAGPGEFAAPTSMFVRKDGGVGVVDARQGRVTLISADGALESSLSGEFTEREVHNACDAHDAGLLGIHLPGQELIRSERDGDVTIRRALLWPDPRQQQFILFQQGLFARSRDGQCVVFSVRGNFFAKIDPATLKAGAFHRFVEPFVFPAIATRNGSPRVDSDRGSANSAAVSGPHLFVLTDSTGGMKSRIVDVYGHADGRYRYSLRLPRTAYKIDVDEGRLLVVEWPESGSRVAVYPLPRPPERN